MAGKKFRFSLDSVLRLREHETHAARQDLADVLRQKHEQEARVVEAEQRLEALCQVGATGRVDPRRLRQSDLFRQAAQQACAEARARLQRLNQLEEEARLRLMEKRSAEETLRHLHDEEATQHRRDQEYAETNFLDEQALTSFHRQRNAHDDR